MAFNYKSCQLVRSNSCLHKAAPIVLIPLYEKYSLALRIASQIAVVFSKKKYFHTSSFIHCVALKGISEPLLSRQFVH